MGARGPLSNKPAQLKPAPKLVHTAAPAYLDEIATDEWTRLVIELKTLSSIDTTILALHCTAYSDWRRYSDALIARGETYTTTSGQVKSYPEYQMKKEAWVQLMKTAAELGFTPNARARMNIPAQSDAADKRTLAQEIGRAK